MMCLAKALTDHDGLAMCPPGRKREPASATGDAIVIKLLSHAGSHAFPGTQLISAELSGSTITCCCADVGGYE